MKKYYQIATQNPVLLNDDVVMETKKIKFIKKTDINTLLISFSENERPMLADQEGIIYKWCIDCLSKFFG